MNNTLQLIFESRGWIQKASNPLLQQQQSTAERGVSFYIDRLPAELRNGIIACTKKEVLV